MNIRFFFIALLAISLSSCSNAQSLDETGAQIGQAAPAIAEVLLNMEHNPSEEQKERLQQISSNEAESEAIRTIAEAVMHFEHAVHPDYLEDLRAIRDDQYATAREKTLADVLLDMRHEVNEEHMARLAEVQ